MRVYYATHVYVPDARRGSTGGGDEDLGVALTRASESAQYLLSLPDTPAVRIEVSPCCAVCYGEGTVRKARARSMFARKPCPECKGGRTPAPATFAFDIKRAE